MKKLIVACALICASVLYAADERKVVVTIEPENVLSTERSVGWQDYVGLGRSLSWRQLFTLARKESELRQEYEQVEKATPGGKGNAFHALTPIMNDNHGLDIASYRHELLKRSVNPQKRDELEKLIRALCQAGHIVLAATEQDFKHHEVYQDEMAMLGFQWGEYFAASVVTEYLGFEEGERKEVSSEGFIEQADGIFMVPASHGKKDAEYWGVVAAVAQRHVGHGRFFRGIHVDVNTDAVKTAEHHGNFTGLHFNGDCDQLREQFQQNGVDLSEKS